MGGRRPQTLCLTMFYTVLRFVLTVRKSSLFLVRATKSTYRASSPFRWKHLLTVVQKSTLILIRHICVGRVSSRARFWKHPVCERILVYCRLKIIDQVHEIAETYSSLGYSMSIECNDTVVGENVEHIWEERARNIYFFRVEYVVVQENVAKCEKTFGAIFINTEKWLHFKKLI